MQKGNTALVKLLNKFICTIQGDGQLAKAYKQTEGATCPRCLAARNGWRPGGGRAAARVRSRWSRYDAPDRRRRARGLAAAAEAAARGLEVALVDERPTLGGQIFKQPGLRSATPRARRRPRPRARADRRGRAPGGPSAPRDELLRGPGTRWCSSPRGSMPATVTARRVLSPPARTTGRSFPGWTLPGVLTAGAAQTLVKTQRVLPGRRARLRRQRAARARIPGSAPPLRRGTSRSRSRRARAPRPGGRGAARVRRPAGTCLLLRDAAGATAASCRAARVPLRYRRIVVRAEGRDRPFEAVIHAAVDGDWRVRAGDGGAGGGRRSRRSPPASSRLSSSSASPAAISRYDEDLGGPVVVCRSLAADDGARRARPPATARASRGSYVADGRLILYIERLAKAVFERSSFLIMPTSGPPGGPTKLPQLRKDFNLAAAKPWPQKHLHRPH